MPSDPILKSAVVPVPGGRAGAMDSTGIQIRDLVYRSRADYSRHAHDTPSLFVMLSGYVREQARRAPVDCPAGAIGFIPAGVEHRSTFGDTPSHGLTIVLHDDWLKRFAPPGSAVSEPGYAQNPIVSAAAFRLHAACRRPDATRTLATEELVVEMLSWATNPNGSGESWAGRRASSHAPCWLRQVTEAVRENGTAPIGLGAVSDAVARHPGHICREFKAAFGCSISEYVQLVRVQRACALLRASDQGLASVALATGFYDQAHFTRVFRRCIGVTPRAYRGGFR